MIHKKKERKKGRAAQVVRGVQTWLIEEEKKLLFPLFTNQSSDNIISLSPFYPLFLFIFPKRLVFVFWRGSWMAP